MNTASDNGELWAALEAYLAARRALGFQLVEEERLSLIHIFASTAGR